MNIKSKCAPVSHYFCIRIFEIGYESEKTNTEKQIKMWNQTKSNPKGHSIYKYSSTLFITNGS